jgi:NAD-dependent deacetylase
MTLELRERLRSVRSVGAITGAGVSAESGIRPYRGAGGIYDDPEQGQRTVEALSGGTLAVDPDRTWRALAQLARQAHGAKPGPAHYALAAIEHKVERFVLLTQNVDGLHQAAGSRNVIDVHGSLEATNCPRCLTRRPLAVSELARLERALRCPTCDLPVRPDAVLFGELLPLDKVARIANELERDPPDLVIVAGTSALFPYICGPVEAAARRGRITIEINPEPTELSAVVGLTLRGSAGHWLPRISRDLPRTAPLVERPRDRLGRPLPKGTENELEPRASPTTEDAIALLLAQRCFEAHEAFERLWHAEAIEADRAFFRGLAQLAVAGCHAQRGNPAGAEALLARARATLARYPEGHRGIQRAELEAAVDRLRDQMVDDPL